MKPLLLAFALAALAGCATQHEPRVMQAPPFYVPTTGIAQNQTNPYHVLPGIDGDIIILRDEKIAFGTTSLGDVSAYTLYTYDQQNIGIRHSGGSGYRYRWVVQEGLSAPPPP